MFNLFFNELCTLESHNFVNTGPFLTKPAPMERSPSGLSIGTGFVKNRPISTKLGDYEDGYSK